MNIKITFVTICLKMIKWLVHCDFSILYLLYKPTDMPLYYKYTIFFLKVLQTNLSTIKMKKGNAGVNIDETATQNNLY